jgi:hypothetical protein
MVSAFSDVIGSKVPGSPLRLSGFGGQAGFSGSEFAQFRRFNLVNSNIFIIANEVNA